MAKVALTRFDVATHLKTEEDFVAYFDECAKLDDGDGKMIIAAINTIVRARGISNISEKTGLTRQGLAKAFGESGNPELITFIKVLDSLGLRLSVSVSQS